MRLGLRRRGGRGREFLGGDGNLLLHIPNLDGAAISWPERRPVRKPRAAGLTIVGVVHLRGISAEWTFGIANLAQQQPGFCVEIKPEWRLALGAADNQVGIASADFLAGLNAPPFVKGLHL